METLELNKLLDEIGYSVHSMNTIAVALSIMPHGELKIPDGLDISWKPKALDKSKIRARNFAERSIFVYVAESLFEYLGKISKNPLWLYPDIKYEGSGSKALRVYNFLRQIPSLEEEMIILVELLCHWRNKIVHASASKADIDKKKRQLLTASKESIYSRFHHFDTEIALNNFDLNKVTLKDVSTLTTMVIKACRAVDNHYFDGIKSIKDFNAYKSLFLNDEDFVKIFKQSASEKRSRQIKRWIEVNYPYLESDIQNKLIEVFIDQS